MGKKTFIELAGASGDKNVLAASIGWFEKSAPSYSAYAQIGALFDTGGSDELGFAAAFGMRKLLSPYIELSPSFSLSSLINPHDYIYFDEGSSTSAAVALALRLYPTKYFSIDLQGVASKDVSGTMLGISGHF